MAQRLIERTEWVRFAYVCDVADLPILVKRQVLEPDETNAACNTTIIIDRMLRNGRTSWRKRMMDRFVRLMKDNNNRGTP